MNYEELLGHAVGIVESVGDYLKSSQPEIIEIEKEGKDFLCDLDLTSNSRLSEELQKVAPGIPIYSEEGEERIKRIKGEYLIIDPLDGSINCSHQDKFWGISVALVKDDQTQLGILYAPALEQLVGVTRTGKVITKGEITLGVRKDENLSKANTQVWLDWGKESEEVISMISKIRKVSLYPQIRLCCSASLLAVAGGRILAYIHPHPGPEDIAAGYLIVEKAGGKVTDLDGQPCSPFSKSIVASNGILHEQILEVLK